MYVVMYSRPHDIVHIAHIPHTTLCEEFVHVCTKVSCEYCIIIICLAENCMAMCSRPHVHCTYPHCAHTHKILHTQRWARAFRDDYHAAVNTNNGTEALNKVLKYNYLPREKNITLSAMCTIMIESFLPDAHQKYLLKLYAIKPVQILQVSCSRLPS